MEVLEAIHSRHSEGKVKSDPLPHELIEKLLDAAEQAPNHYKVRPWRFAVLTGEGRNRLGEVMAASQREHHPEFSQAVFDKTRALPLRAPAVIVVAADKPSEAKVLEIENICAAAAATENLLLAAHAMGLGAKWRTGEWARDPAQNTERSQRLLSLLKQVSGSDENTMIYRMLYLRFVEQESVNSIARRLGMKPNTVTQRIRYYIKKLRETQVEELAV